MKKSFALFLGLLALLIAVPALAGDTSTVTSTVVSTSSIVAPTPMVVINPDTIDTHEQIFSVVAMLSKAFKSKKWMLVAALLLTVCVSVVRMFKLGRLLPSHLVPWATMATAMSTSVALGLQTGEPWTQIVLTGISVGVASIGGFETLGKMVRAVVQKPETVVVEPAVEAPPSQGGG